MQCIKSRSRRRIEVKYLSAANRIVAQPRTTHSTHRRQSRDIHIFKFYDRNETKQQQQKKVIIYV